MKFHANAGKNFRYFTYTYDEPLRRIVLFRRGKQSDVGVYFSEGRKLTESGWTFSEMKPKYGYKEVTWKEARAIIPNIPI